MNDDDLFRTARLQSLRGATPAYMPGINVYLQREVQGFAKGSLARVVGVQSSRPGEHRYQLTVGDHKMWVFEADIRPTQPRDSGVLSHADPGSQLQNALGTTQRMHTMTLSQRMAGLGASVTPRMHPLTQEERLKKLVQTNRLRTLGAAGQPAEAPAPPDQSGPMTAEQKQP